MALGYVALGASRYVFNPVKSHKRIKPYTSRYVSAESAKALVFVEVSHFWMNGSRYKRTYVSSVRVISRRPRAVSLPTVPALLYVAE